MGTEMREVTFCDVCGGEAGCDVDVVYGPGGHNLCKTHHLCDQCEGRVRKKCRETGEAPYCPACRKERETK